jgi:hypothetical protein
MSKQETTADNVSSLKGDLTALEENLGKVLVLIQRILPRLDEPGRASEVQAALRQAGTYLESVRRTHELQNSPQSSATTQRVTTGVAPEIAAVIAAAVAVLFDRPYRLVSVQQVETPVPYLNVWALEGRTQIFQSHKIR